MPGSIQVSVLDFKELPLSSNSVKLSLGKVEHEAGEKGSFSFPLANLRDNLIITVQDSEGNQVSQSGVRTMSIIEKGIWDDVFPIEGGGLVHMKLQFFLSEEEQTRIRLLRESAMKKKQVEILGSRYEETNEESTSNKNDAISQQQGEVPEKLLEDTETRDYLKIKSEPLYNRVEKSDKQILEDKNPSFVKKTSKEDNEIQLQETGLLKRSDGSSSSDVGSSRLTVAEKMKSLEKTPQNIKKMISVFESTISQDRVPLKPVSAKSYRFGTSRLLKDYYEKSTSLKNSEDSSSSRLRNSFSTGDLRKNFSNITTEGDQVDREGVNDEKESIDGRESSKVNLDYFDQDGRGRWAFLDEKRHFCITAQGDKTISLLSDCKIEGKGHQEKDEEIESPANADVEASNGSFGQAMKIALVVGFGALAFLFRQTESGKGKKKENIHALRNQVPMNRRGSSEEQGRRFGVLRLS
ncbi:uncharacterized protein LOC110893741 isoform X2 [Helianthus annuus]|uniref:uncharacterized protein LOC110893741 isoform X2 n=1 Tax=Helianthus annuus TaxID=4232 RepID=UPI000B9047D5|nr:uncharacterized protein LOC110893741 isoform X2 [Helianthus annuus]